MMPLGNKYPLVMFSAVFAASIVAPKLTAQNETPSKPPEAEVQALRATLKEGRVHASAIPGVIAAIYEAMKVKSCATVPELVQLLALRDPAVDDGDEFRVIAIYPAVEALSEIGSCALPALTDVIKQHEGDSLQTRLAVFALKSILHGKAETVAFLRDAAAREKSSLEGPQRLNRAAQELEAAAK